jgi:2-C-methyl-D-erythritol 2,4-cyclodiphosphate synthase
MDAMLGAAALGDIGRHFPDNDSRYEGISSHILLTRVNDMLKEAGCRLGNVDITILAQRPKLASYIPQMVTIIADTLKTDKTNINVKATTEEGLGFTGSGEGIAAHAVVLIEKYEL